MKTLNKLQIDSLLTGVKLAAEIKTNSYNFRKFITVYAYQYNINGKINSITKTFKSEIQEDIFFFIWKYVIPSEYISNDYDVHEENLLESIKIKDINSIKNLENELNKYIDDLSELVAEWYTENPI